MQAKGKRPLSTVIARRILFFATWCFISNSACVDVGERGQEAATPRRAEAFHLQADLRLHGAPDTPFGVVSAVATDMLGRFYVLDGMLQTVYVFDENGDYVNSLGRQGSGPGEFSGAMDVAVSPDSLIWVTDGMGGRHVVFDLDGHVVRTVARTYRGASYLGDRPFDMDGGYVDWVLRFPNETAFSASDIIEAYPLVVRPGADADTMPPVRFSPHLVDIGNERRPAVFFAPTLLIAMDGRGSIWFSDSREYRVVRRSLAGDTIGELRLGDEAAPVSEEDRRTIQGLARGRSSMLQYLEVLPDKKPTIVGIVPDGAGRVLVVPETATARRGEVVDLFEETGGYLGRMLVPDRVDLPPGRVAMHATGEFLYIGGTDETGTPVLLRLRVVASK